MLAGWASTEPEVHGLVALMEIQSSRLEARIDAAGRPVPLLEQDRGRWDPLLIRRGFQALLRARELGPAGPYVLQAAIAACHARARRPADSDWGQIAALYAQLQRVAPSPVVELNRAVAVGFSEGPAAGLAVVDGIRGLDDYHLLHSVRAELLSRLGRVEEAHEHLCRAAALTANAREQDVLLARGAVVG
jgi:predicted RNA polymerase sigma factor